MSVVRRYAVTFEGRPTIAKIISEMQRANQIFSEYSHVAITTNSSSDDHPEREEVVVMSIEACA